MLRESAARRGRRRVAPSQGALIMPHLFDRTGQAETMAKKAAPRKTGSKTAPLVGIVMGSQADWETMRHAADTLDKLKIGHEVAVHSAHRTPDRLAEWVRSLDANGAKVFIAGAGMAAALPGVVAALTARPVFGVPMETRMMGGLDSLLSMCQM